MKHKAPPYNRDYFDKYFRLSHKANKEKKTKKQKPEPEDHGQMECRILAALEHHACANTNTRCHECKLLFDFWSTNEDHVE